MACVRSLDLVVPQGRTRKVSLLIRVQPLPQSRWGIQELALCGPTSWWESSALKGNVSGGASLPPDPQCRAKGTGPLKQHSAFGIRNGFTVVFNQVVIAYSKRNSGKIQLLN